jgi:hypothetical protein
LNALRQSSLVMQFLATHKRPADSGPNGAAARFVSPEYDIRDHKESVYCGYRGREGASALKSDRKVANSQRSLFQKSAKEGLI